VNTGYICSVIYIFRYTPLRTFR